MARPKGRQGKPNKRHDEAKWVPVAVAAKHIHVSKRTMERLIRHGYVKPAILPDSGHQRVNLDELDSFMDSRKAFVKTATKEILERLQ